MTSTLSISTCIRRAADAKAPDATFFIWSFFHERALRIAQHELRYSYKSSGDANDATNAAFFSCFLKLQNQLGMRLGREEFWNVLRRSVKKHSDRLRVQRYTRKCQHKHFSTLNPHEVRSLEHTQGRSSQAEQEMDLLSEVEALVNSLGLDPSFKRLLQLKLENLTSREIAVELGVHVGTVDRKLRSLRRGIERLHVENDS